MRENFFLVPVLKLIFTPSFQSNGDEISIHATSQHSTLWPAYIYQLSWKVYKYFLALQRSAMIVESRGAKCTLQNANESGKEKKSNNLIGLIPLIRIIIISYVLIIVTNSTRQLTCKMLGFLSLFSLRRMTFCQNKPW